jgi:hypothetical protein
MRENMTVEERQSRRGRLSNIRGRVLKAKRKLDGALVVSKKSGQMWEWRISNIHEDLRKLIANLETEEYKLKD